MDDSRDSSPRCRDPDADHHHHHHHHRQPSFDDQPPPKVKLMCSFGGRIQPRPHDNHLTYVAGDTKILAVDRHVKFPSLLAKLSSLPNAPSNLSFFKYQLPGEDLDALISVSSDEDLHHMMLEYDRLSRSSPRPARLRLFLFPLTTTATTTTDFNSKSERQWFVDALNSVHVPEDSLPPPPPLANPDFLFGLDKPPAEDPPAKDSAPESESFPFPEDREAVREYEHEIQEVRRMQIANDNNEERRMKAEEDEENNGGRVYGVNGGGDCFVQKNTEKVTPLVTHAHAHAHARLVHPAGSVTGTVSFMHERNNNNAEYSLALPTTGNEIYFIQTPSGIFQAVRPVTGPVGQPVYLLHAAGSVRYTGAEVGATAGRGGGARW